MSEKASLLKQTKENLKTRVNKRRIARHERWADRFPFNMIHDMLHGITGEPR